MLALTSETLSMLCSGELRLVPESVRQTTRQGTEMLCICVHVLCVHVLCVPPAGAQIDHKYITARLLLQLTAVFDHCALGDTRRQQTRDSSWILR